MIERAIPVLVVRGCRAAVDFYRTAFGAEPARIAELEGDGGDPSFAELRLGPAAILLVQEDLSRQMTSPMALGGTVGAVHLRVDDVDARFRHLVELGAAVVGEPHDTGWGDRWARVRCPFGHVWQLAAPARG